MIVAFLNIWFGWVLHVRNWGRLLLLYFSKIPMDLFTLFRTLFYVPELSLPGRAAWYWSGEFLTIEAYPDKLLKGRIFSKTEGNEFEEIVEILICKDSIVDALELFVGWNGLLECVQFCPVLVVGDNFGYLDLPLPFNVQTLEEIIHNPLPPFTHTPLQWVNQLCVVYFFVFVRAEVPHHSLNVFDRKEIQRLLQLLSINHVRSVFVCGL